MRDRPARRWLALIALSAAASACLGPGDFHCEQHPQCGGTGAFCEVNGRCSVADASCSSQRRYVHNAGADADLCVPDSCDQQSAIAALAAGAAHACLVRNDGAVQCWGRNDDGQLGDGTRTPRSLAVRLPGLAASAVATGQRHTCAVVAPGGAVVCWGADDAGQLGDGGDTDQLMPVAVALPAGARAIAVVAGLDFSCAVLSDGTVSCWGDDSVGQLGDDGAAATSREPSRVVGLSGVATMSATWQHACAVGVDGSLHCWGSNAQGQLGDGTTTDQKHPVEVTALSAVDSVGTGVSHTCAITNAGTLYCWGSDAYGQLGDGTSGPAPVTAPEPIAIVQSPIGVAVGAQHTCAIQTGGAVFCWGQNASGQLGTGGTNSLDAPVPIALGPARAIAAGLAFSCAETVDGAVFCWGDNHYGQLGMGSGTIRTRPGQVLDVRNATSIAAGDAHTCAGTATTAGGTTASDTLCWGADQAGQLGDGITTDRARAKPITAQIGALEVATGGAHTCAVTAAPNPALWCWGRGNAGQLGLGPSKLFDFRQPTTVALPGTPAATPRAVATGAAHSCVLASGQALCFGSNADGELGDGTTTDHSLPAPVAFPAGPAPPTLVAVAAGGAHSCALDDGGQIWCWGQGDEGELGDGLSKDQTAPVAVALGGEKATALAVGGAHTCAVAEDGALYCWGRNAEGQLGLAAASAPMPTLVPGFARARAVAAGATHTCAIAADQTVSCWGANDDGQLGNGVTSPSPTSDPSLVVGLANVEGISAGGAHSCARRADGTVWCWGADTSGQLGDAVALSNSTPQLARIACE